MASETGLKWYWLSSKFIMSNIMRNMYLYILLLLHSTVGDLFSSVSKRCLVPFVVLTLRALDGSTY